jgi:hypothetical protein
MIRRRAQCRCIFAISVLAELITYESQNRAQIFDFLADLVNRIQRVAGLQSFQRLINPPAAQSPHGLCHRLLLFEMKWQDGE